MKCILYTDQMLINSTLLMELVGAENMRQVKKWGIQTLTPFEWLTFTTEELGELAEAISKQQYRNGTVNAVIQEAIQVATLALKIADMYIEEEKA